MGKTAEKLHSQQGASILLALVFFLVCGFVGAVILGAAATNAQKIQGRREEQQAYFSVSSAARLLRDAVEDLEYTGQEHWEEYGCTGKSLNFVTGPHTDVFAYDYFQQTAGANGTLTELLRRGAEGVYRSQLQFAERTPFTGWSAAFTVDDGACPVAVEATIDRAYTLTFVLAPADPSLAADHQMTLICTGLPQAPQETAETLSCTHLVEYGGTEDFETVVEETSFTGCIHTYTTAVAWSRGTISKGVSDHG